MNVARIAILTWIAVSSPASALDYTMGSSVVDVTPPVGVPLAGYGGVDRRILPWDFFNKHKYAHFLKPSTGVLDPIRSKALVVTLGTEKVLFLSLDTIGIEAPFLVEIRNHAKTLGIQHVIANATHTHSGPGTLGRNAFYEILACDRFQPKVYKKFIEGVKTSITEAAIAQEPVRLYRTDFSAVGFSRNRRDHPDQLDTTAHLLYGRNDRNEIVGGFVNFGVHNTVLGESNLKFSADFAGGIERQLTRRLGSKHLILFMSGPQGDVSPQVDGGYEEIDPKGAEFAELAAQALPASVEVSKRIQARSGQFRMPKGKVTLSNCMKLPRWLRKLSFGARQFPRNFELTHLLLGDILMVTWPGEATVELGQDLQRMAAQYGFPTTWNLGLSNGYLGYFLSAADFDEGGYEICVSYHGRNAASTLMAGHQQLLEF